MERSEQELVRRDNLTKIRELGIEPFPAATFPVTHLAEEINEKAEFDEENMSTNYKEVTVAGRLMARRIMGKAAFASIQDSSGRIQIYVSRDDIAPGEDKALYNTLFKKLLDLHGGAAARPFATHHNTLDIPMYLRIANELYLKRLIVGGFDAVYEFSKNFRNEGMDRTHNPEFTAIEFYVAYKDYNWMMDTTERMLEYIIKTVNGGDDAIVKADEHEIDFAGPYRRLTMADSIKEYTGEDINGADEDELRAIAKRLHVELDKTMGRGKIIDEIFGDHVEANLIQPTFITDYPVEMSPLTKKHRSKPGLVERFELFVNGKEIGNCYSELNDPIDQRERFEEQVKLAARGDDESMPMDEDFLRALEYGMPPTAGIGFGIDRLVMLVTGQKSIQEVLFFPQMKPEA